MIPPNIIAKAKGIAVMTVAKAGFGWSGRAGSGLVIARLPSGEWSAPSAIGTAGIGFGFQIGAELTDHIIILNTESAVKAFSLGGNVTLGGSLSVAAGPYGRSAEAGGSVGQMAPIYSYSKSKGAFVGVSLEGSVIIERKDTNAQFYLRKITAQEILSGEVEPPASANPLYRALDRHMQKVLERESVASLDRPPSSSTGVPMHRASTYSPPPTYEKSRLSFQSSSRPQTATSPKESAFRTPPPLPPNRHRNTAVALYDFDPERDSDLGFKQGDIITITKRTESDDDWWTGSCNGRSGDFPANFVEVRK
ncbi:hypothetical protein HDV02_004809 [Globomyces sp. JEL0801]|nr:hypothetical protein HDV02_004809 [Globomyces sp. JEL0801]